MRRKILATRTRRSNQRARPAESTADWLVEAELGWGLPHGLVAVLAGVVVVARVVSWELDRLSAWLDRRDGGDGVDGPST